jgi:hypothetical protein
MISSVTPCRMNMVDSVTTMGWSRNTATKKPLKAPTAMPMPIPAIVHRVTLAPWAIGSMLLASTTLTSEITAPADRSKPPDRMTIVWPIAAIAVVAPPLDRKDMSK